MTNVVLNPLWATADLSGEPGEAEDWTRVSYQKYPGFARFKQPHGFLATADRFQDEDAPARIVGSSPFVFGTATGGSATSLVDATKSWTVNEFIGHTFRVVSGTGFGFGDIFVTSNTPTTLNYASPGFTPDLASRYVIDDPFALPTSPLWAFIVAGVFVAPVNAIQFSAVDLRSALPPGSSFHLYGPPPNTQLDGYWTVVRVLFIGSDSYIMVAEDVLAMAPGARAGIPPVLACTACEHAWQASTIDTTAYPIAPLAAGQTIQVRIDRGASQTIAFIGGETTALDVAEVIDELLIGGGARVTAGQVEVYSDTRGPTSFVQVLPITAGLTFYPAEERGHGQWAQMWPQYFTTPATAATSEIVDVLAEHWKHVRVSCPGGASGDPVYVQTERKGATATLFVDDTVAGIHDSAALWPIGVRTPGVDDKLWFDVAGSPITVILAPTDRTTDLVSNAINAKFLATGVDAVSTYSADRVYVDSRLSLACTGGTANADIGFPSTFTTYGGGTVARVLGLDGASAVGVDDVGWFSDFSSVASLFATFADGSPVSGTADTFTWQEIYATMDATTNFAAGFKSFYGATWLVERESFDEAWADEWLSTYAAFTPVAGAWKPPGVSPSAQLVGRELTFPLTVASNRNKLSIHSETDGTWYTLSLTGAVYATVAALVTHLNVKLTASGITDDIAFGNLGNSLTLGWDGTATADGAIHLASAIGLLADMDARPTLGLHPLAAGPALASVPVPEGFYALDPVGTWDAERQYGVDPGSRLVFDTVQDPALGTWLAETNGDKLATFNALDPAIVDSYVEAFRFFTVVPGGSYPGWGLAVFDATIAPENYEDFEEGW